MNNGIDLLKKIVRVANSGIGFEDRLQGVLDLLVRKEGIERVVLFLTLPESDNLEFKKSSPRDIVLVDRPLHVSKTPFKELLQNRSSLHIAHLHRKDHKILLKHPLIKGFDSLRALPVQDDNLLYGVLVLLSREASSQDPWFLEILDLVSVELSGILKNSRIYTESKKRIAELSVLYQVGKVIGSTLELEELIQRTVAIIAQVINAKGAALSISDKTSGEVIIASEFGRISSEMREKIFKASLNGKKDCIFTREMLARLTEGAQVHPGDKESTSPGPLISSLVCIFLPFKGPYLGRLFIFDKMELGGQRGSQFNEEDLSLLSTMGNIIASSLENAITFQKIETLACQNEKMVRNLSTLYQIDTAMMTTAFLKDLSQIILEAITLEEGLGFNRAILFLPDSGKKYLAPTGWSVQESAESESGTLSEKGMSGNGLSHFLIQKASRIRSQRRDTENVFSSLKIYLNKESGILARTFLEGRTFLVERALNQEDRYLAEKLHLESFVALPMRAKGKVVGVIEVDNYLSNRPITQEDLYLLKMMAHQAGLAFENARLYNDIEKSNQELKVTRERLMESEKMVALGEMTSGLAHEIRNPLVSIGGFVRRLHKRFTGDEQVQSYFQVIINEVERLEKILNEITDFSQDPRGRYKEWDLDRIVEEALELIQRELEESHIRVYKDWGTIPKVFGDRRQLRHIFYNLFLNSCQAMAKGGTLTLRTFLDQESDRPWVVCEIRDTGGGIPPELLHNIFNPFFTTKDHGSGLGLSIVHKILTRHKGEMNIDNRPGEGVSFLVKFPAGKETQHYFRKFKTMGEEDHETLTDR